MSERKMSVAGSFYPNSADEIKRYIEHFNQNFSINGELKIKPRAIIAPHAGYIYSGFTANLAYNLSSKQDFKRVIVIGPSHKVYFEGASISMYDFYDTPLGKIKIDTKYCDFLLNEYSFLDFYDEVHSEHSTETQAPFIKNYFEDLEIIEIVYGKIEHNDLTTLVNRLFEDRDNFVVISTDLSHFHDLKKANQIDNICLNAIAKKDLQMFEKGCEACGLKGVKAVIESSIKNDFKTEILHYCTSYDKTKDDKRVVGYTSVLIGEEI